MRNRGFNVITTNIILDNVMIQNYQEKFETEGVMVFDPIDRFHLMKLLQVRFSVESGSTVLQGGVVHSFNPIDI